MTAPSSSNDLEPCPWAGRAHPAGCTCVGSGLLAAANRPNPMPASPPPGFAIYENGRA